MAGDGSTGAPGGTPQVPHLLDGYAVRPTWEVAGVDYAVGVHPGITLKVPTANNLPAGAELGNHVIYINGTDVTLSGYNLSGYTVLVNDTAKGTATIIDCAATDIVIRSVVNAQANVVVKYCSLDGGGTQSDPNFNMIKMWVPQLTVEYCEIKNGAAGIQAGGIVTVKYNVLSGFAWFPGEHANAIAIQGSNNPNNYAVVEFNTLYGADSRNAEGFPVGIGTGIAFYNDAGGNFYNSTVANNTVIANLPGSGSYLTGFYVDPPGTATGMVVRDNFYASVNGYNDGGSGAYGALYISNRGNVQATYTGNIDMNTGNLVAGSAAGTGGEGTSVDVPVIAGFSDDTGVAGDHVTNDNTLTLSGKAAANSTVKIYDDAKLIGTVTADGKGAWAASAALADGAHKFTATATSSGVTSAASTVFSVTVDTAVPNSPVISSSTAAGTGSYLLKGTADAGSTVNILDGTNQVGTIKVDASGAWSHTVSSLSVGTHSLTAKAVDVAGNASGASAAVSVAVSGSGPTAPTGPTAPAIDAKILNDSGVSATDHITNDNTVTLTGTAVAGSTIKVLDGSNQVGSATVDGSGHWTVTTSALVDGSHSLTATATTSTSDTSPAPALFEDFQPWSGTVSPDGIWRIAGTWTGTGGNTLQPGNVKFTDTYPGETNTGFMSLTVPAGSPLRGAELQSLPEPGYSYGYYEVRMKTADVKNGGVASFFWIEQPNYGSHEWDVEFTLNDSWVGTTNPGRVSFSVEPSGKNAFVNLGFNPSQEFHDYGFLWTPGHIDFTVDGEVVRTVTDPSLVTDATGYIMMNTWSGSWFGGGPPSQDATSVYDWVKFYPNATSVPPEGDSTGGGATTTSAPLSVTVDTKAPTAPMLKANSVVDTNHVQLSGTAEAGSAIKVYDGSNLVGSGTAGADGSWSIITNGLSNGTHTLTAAATDVAGNASAASQSVTSVIGASAPPSSVTIESVGSTKLVLVGDNYRLDGASGSGPSLKYGGADFVDGSDGTWAPIGAEKTATGYQVVWKEASTGRYTAWNTDNNGNYVSHVSDLTGSGGSVSGTNSALKLFETSFHQDLNGDGQIGASTAGAPLSSVALTTMSKNWSDIVTIKGVADANSQIKLYDGNSSLGTVTAAADGSWSFKTSSAVSDTVHTYTAEQIDSTGQVVGTSGNAILGSTGSNTLNGTSGDDIFIGGRQSDTFVFAANFGRDVIRDFKASGTAQDTIHFSKTVFDSFASVLSHASQDGQDVAISTGNDTLTLKNTKLGALSSNDFHFA